MFNETEIKGPSLPAGFAELLAETEGVNRRVSPALRRLASTSDREAAEPAPADDPAMDTPTAEAGAAAAGAAIIAERQTTHGMFEDNARVSQVIKEIFRAQPGWANLTDVERECMDMIALKFSRMLSGRSLEKQHWEDVVGYGQLALNTCEGKLANG